MHGGQVGGGPAGEGSIGESSISGWLRGDEPELGR